MKVMILITRGQVMWKKLEIRCGRSLRQDVEISKRIQKLCPCVSKMS